MLQLEMGISFVKKTKFFKPNKVLHERWCCSENVTNQERTNLIVQKNKKTNDLKSLTIVFISWIRQTVNEQFLNRSFEQTLRNEIFE